MNKVILVGRLTREPEVKYANGANGNQMAIARFTLAVDRKQKSGDQSADFIRCVAFGKTGEFIEKYVFKGTKLITEGRIQTGSYQDKDGKTVYTTDVVVEAAEFAESKKANETQQNSNPTPEPAPAPTQQATPEPVQGEGFTNIDSQESLPFNF